MCNSSIIQRNERIAFAAAIGISLAWFAAVLAVKLTLYARYALLGDLATYCNALYNTGDGRLLYTDLGWLRHGQTTFLQEHFAPSFALMVPLYRLWPSPVLLLVTGAAAFALAGFILNRLVRAVFAGPGYEARVFAFLPAAFQVLYLVHPATVYAGIEPVHGFHHDAFMPPLLLGGIYFGMRRRWIASVLLFILLFGLKENVPILALMTVGLAFLLKYKAVPLNVVLAATLSAGVMFAGSYYLQHLADNRHVRLVEDYLWLPGLFIAAKRIVNWWPVFLFLPAFACPLLLLPCLAELSLHLVAISEMNSWRSALLVAGMAAAAVFGLRWLHGKIATRKSPAVARMVLTVYLVLAIVPAFVLGGRVAAAALGKAAGHRPSYTAGDVRAIAAMIPHDARTAVSTDLLLSFVNRPHMRLPEQAGWSDYIVVSASGCNPEDDIMRKEVKRESHSGALGLVARRGGITLWRRGSPASDPR